MMQIFIYKDGKSIGPFTRDEIFVRVRQKEFSMDDLACTEQAPEWKSLAEVLSAKATMVVLAERELPPTPPVSIPGDEPLANFGMRLTDKREAEPAESTDAVAGLKRLAALVVLGACLYRFGGVGWERLRAQFARATVVWAAWEGEPSSRENPVSGANRPELAITEARNTCEGKATAMGGGSDENKAGVGGERVTQPAESYAVALEGDGKAVEQSPASLEPVNDEDPDVVPGLAVQPASYFKKR